MIYAWLCLVVFELDALAIGLEGILEIAAPGRVFMQRFPFHIPHRSIPSCCRVRSPCR
jgi:hypothetical protein